MRILIGFALCAHLVLSQESAPPLERVSSDKAPPELDKALRARVSQFYQAHVDAKYRLADLVVSEDSKDLFFAAPKPKYDGFEIVRINYWPDFSKAEAVVATKGSWYIRGQKMPVTMPLTSNWKVVDGQWFWYVVPVKEYATPFGPMHRDNADSPAAPATAVAAIPGDPRVLAEQILSSVKVDLNEVMLSSYEPATAQVHVSNGMQGNITLRADIDGAFPGLSLEFDQTTIAAGKAATLTIKCDPKDKAAKPTLTARIYVDPTNQIIPVKLMFAIPPEIEKMIPKEARPNRTKLP